MSAAAEMNSELLTAESASRSSVELSTNAKGETVVKVKVYAGDTAQEVSLAAEIAQAQYDALCQTYRGGVPRAVAA